MAVSTSCDCGKAFTLRDEFAGKRVKCPVCNRVFQVPIVATLADPLETADLLSGNPTSDFRAAVHSARPPPPRCGPRWRLADLTQKA